MKKRIATVAFIATALILNLLLFLVADMSVPKKILACVVVDIMAVLCILNIESVLRVPLDIYRDRTMFLSLVKNDFQARFAGSYLGFFWAFFQPVITIVLYWFVFQVGLRSGQVSDHPFILYLMAGMVPWFYFSEAWGSASGSLIEYNYLVKKVVFNVGFLPAIKVFSAMIVHLFFTTVVVVMTLFYGYGVHLHLLQLLYYMGCSVTLVLGLSYITAAVNVFFRDMAQIVNIFLTIGVWITPIMWNLQASMQNPVLQKIFKLNPVYYIVAGFRDSLLDRVWFWEKPLWSVYFWCVAIAVYLVGVKLFNRLKVHFSDVL